MKSKTKYIIRERYFRYNDENYDYHGQGKIKHIFDNLDEAKTQCMNLERMEYRENLNSIAQFIGNSTQEDGQRFKKLNQYIQKFFTSEVELTNLYHNLEIPQELDDNEINDLINIVGVKFYELISFEDEIKFYVAELNLDMFPNNKEYMLRYFRNEVIEKFYNSEQEALKRMIYYLDDIAVPEIKGKLNEISNTPNILKSIIESSEHLSYENEQIKFMFGMSTGLFEIHDLLINKPILIEMKSLKEI